MPDEQHIEESETQALTPRVEGYPNLRTGRPRGAVNRLTRERREFLDMVFGKAGTKERKEIALNLRTQLMEGTISHNIGLLLMTWLLGKPKETVEIQHTAPDLSELTDEQLAERARLVAKLAESGEYIEAELVSSDAQS